MDKKLPERIRISLREKRDNLSTWLTVASPLERQLRLGSSTEEAVQAHLETLDQAFEIDADQTLGQCEVCNESIETELLEMDYTCCVCLDHLSADESRQLETELEMAGRVQQTLLPHKVPEISGLDIAAYSRPAQIVGGDYFDFFAFRETQVTLQPRDLLVMYTDGLTEATNMANEGLGQERLTTWLTRETNLTANDAVRIVLGGLREFTIGKPADDDITIVVSRLETE